MKLLIRLLQSQASGGDISAAQVSEAHLPARANEGGVGRGDSLASRGDLQRSQVSKSLQAGVEQGRGGRGDSSSMLGDDKGASEIVACLLALTTDAPAELWEGTQVIQVRQLI